jgi:hypothetical protein
MAFAVSIKEFQGVRIRCNVQIGPIGDWETFIWRKSWFGRFWMLVFEEQRRYIAWHADAAAARSIVPFDVHVRKFIA